MNKKNKMINKLMPVIVITILTISFAQNVFAYDGDSLDTDSTSNITNERTISKNDKKNKNSKRNKKMSDYKDIQQAIENKNYEAWKNLLLNNNTKENEKLLSVINKDNFEKYANAKILAKNGDHTEINKLKVELGLNYKNKK